MANKKVKKSKEIRKEVDISRKKWGKVSYYVLIGLIFAIPFCLVCGWLSGNTKLTEITDNVVTALIQNYNYILGMFVLVPVIAYIYSKIKEELSKKMLSDSAMVSWRIFCLNYCYYCYNHNCFFSLSN